nr:YdcF family protein [Brevibacterium renqingii]
MRVPSSVSGPTLTGGVAIGLLAAVFAFGEITHLRSSRRRLGTTRSSTGSDQIIVVLGFRNSGVRANWLNRFRVRAGLRSIDPTARSAVVVFCGGAVGGRVPEARLLERYAREELGYTGRVLLETDSATTWENIAEAVPLIDEVLRPDSTISIASNSHHAEKARDHLWQLRPDLGRRLVAGADYRFGELPFVKPIAAARGLLALRTLDREKAAL